MGTEYLYLYKVSAKHTPDVYVAAYNQREAVEKVKDNEFFCEIDDCQLAVTYVDMVTV